MHFDKDFHLTKFRTKTNWEQEKKALAYSYLMECAKGKSVQELIDDELFASQSYKKISEYRWYLEDYNPGELYLSSNFEQVMYVMHRHHWINKMAGDVLKTQVSNSRYYAQEFLTRSFYKAAQEYADTIGMRMEFELSVHHYLFKGK